MTRPTTTPAAPRTAPIPRLLLVPAGIGTALLLLPLLALLVRADWPALPAAVTSPASLAALELSLGCGLLAVLTCLVLGVPLALLLARHEGPIVRVLRGLVTLPLVLPPLVGGIALLYLFGRHGLLGRPLETVFGLRLPFSTAAVVIAETFVAMPFLVLSLEGSLRTAGVGYEAVAATLGARRATVFRRVTLPLVGPGLLSATVLCFARALGEFGATALFAGNNPGVTQTVPLAIYNLFNGGTVDQDTAVALSLLLMAAAALILIFLRPRRVPA